MPDEPTEHATELEWLRWFYSYADFGPADEDVRESLRRRFVRRMGKLVPVGYEGEQPDA